MLVRSFVSLRAGDQADLTPLGASPLLSPSLASCPLSLRSFFVSHTYSVYAGGRYYLRLRCCFLRSHLWFLVSSLVFAVPLAGYIVWSYFRQFVCQFTAGTLTLSSTFAKAPCTFAAEETCFTRGEWRFTWVAERQVCSFVSSPLSNTVCPLCPSIIDPAGSVGPRGTRLVLRSVWVLVRVWLRFAMRLSPLWSLTVTKLLRWAKALWLRLWWFLYEVIWTRSRDLSREIATSDEVPDSGLLARAATAIHSKYHSMAVRLRYQVSVMLCWETEFSMPLYGHCQERDLCVTVALRRVATEQY